MKKGLPARDSGFTLLEIMIVVAILGILSAIAFPSYDQYVLRGKRSEGRAALMEAAARMERYYSDHNKYSQKLGKVGISKFSENNHYKLTAQLLDANAQQYMLTATPLKFTDNGCGALQLQSNGDRASSGTLSADECWGK